MSTVTEQPQAEKRAADEVEVSGPKPKCAKPTTIKAEQTYKIFQLKNNVFERSADGGWTVRCWCGVPCKIHRHVFVCGNRGVKNAKCCKISFASAAIDFMTQNDYLHDFEHNSRLRYVDCCECHAARLIVPTNESFSAYGQPTWACDCEKSKKLYIDVLDTYRGDRAEANKVWNMDAIEAQKIERVTSKKEVSAKQTADWAAMQETNAEEV